MMMCSENIELNGLVVVSTGPVRQSTRDCTRTRVVYEGKRERNGKKGKYVVGVQALPHIHTLIKQRAEWAGN